MLSDKEIAELIASEAKSQKDLADRIGPKAFLVSYLIFYVRTVVIIDLRLEHKKLFVQLMKNLLLIKHF
jgi:hypothetical protein